MNEEAKKTAQRIMEEILAEAKVYDEPRRKIRAPRSSLHQLIKTPEQAKRFLFMMNAVRDGLI